MPREHGVLLLQGGPQGSHLEDVKNSRRPDLDGFIHVFIAPLDVIARHKVLLSTLTAFHCPVRRSRWEGERLLTIPGFRLRNC